MIPINIAGFWVVAGMLALPVLSTALPGWGILPNDWIANLFECSDYGISPIMKKERHRS
jgi:hypothetical protein